MEKEAESLPAGSPNEQIGSEDVDKKRRLDDLNAEVARTKEKIDSLKAEIAIDQGKRLRSELTVFVRILRKEWVTLVASIVLGTLFILIAAVLLNIGDQTIKAFIIQLSEQRVQSYLGRLFVSPAVGGVAALSAAAITAAVIFAQLRHTKAKDHEENWWGRYEWITERAFPSKAENKDNAISEDFALVLLKQLEVEAVSDLQKKACSNFMSLVVRELPDEPGGTSADEPDEVQTQGPANEPDEVQTQGPTEVSEETPKNAPTRTAHSIGPRTRGTIEDERVFKAALEYVETTEGTSSSSRDAEVYVLKRQIADALSEMRVNFRKVLSPDGDQFTVRRVGGRLSVIALPRDSKVAQKRISHLRRMGRPALAISPKPLSNLSLENNVMVLYWHPDMGSEKLVEKIDHFLQHLKRAGLLDAPRPGSP